MSAFSFTDLLYVGLGGAIGTVLRFQVWTVFTKLFQNISGALLLVNLVGAFIAGGVLALPAIKELQLFVLVGFLGGMTTFSSLMSFMFNPNFSKQWRTFILGAHFFGAIFLGQLGYAISLRLLV